MFSKNMLADELKIPVTFGKLYKDEAGNPITFNFVFRLETEADAEKLEQQNALNERSVDERRLDRLCLLLAEPPQEFSDFPKDERPLEARAREYFGDRRMRHIVGSAMGLYDKAVLPDELFRGF